MMHYPFPKQNYKVLVRCMTYNQSKYIEDALNSFAMQQTSFPFVCLVMDDASTDGEQDVIKQWIEQECDMAKAEIINIPTSFVVIVPHKTNATCTFAFYLLTQNLYGTGKKTEYITPWREKCKYEAMCEGDDYWIDSNKLQKQFDFMENHSDCSLCHHDFLVLKDEKLKKRNISIPKKQNLASIAKYNTVATLSMFYRIPKEPLVPTDFTFDYPVYQFFYNIRLAEMGNIYYINEQMAVYRESDTGIYSMQSIEKQFIMSVGNTANMIKWFKYRHKRPEIVRILNRRIFFLTISFIIKALRKRKFISALKMCNKTLQIMYYNI